MVWSMVRQKGVGGCSVRAMYMARKIVNFIQILSTSTIYRTRLVPPSNLMLHSYGFGPSGSCREEGRSRKNAHVVYIPDQRHIIVWLSTQPAIMAQHDY